MSSRFLKKSMDKLGLLFGDFWGTGLLFGQARFYIVFMDVYGGFILVLLFFLRILFEQIS